MLPFLLLAAATTEPPSAEPKDQADIIVTGERTPRRLKDTASSVVVLGHRDIEAASADRVEQMLALLPNVQLGNGSEGPAIRGLDTTGALQALPAFLGGNRPRTTLIVDGRRTTYNEFVFGSAPVWDVNRIEVFRSPQTTTQGQNSIAGAIFVYSNDPTFTPEYRARSIVGDYRTREVSAVASGPLSGDVAMRVSGDLRYSRTTSRITDRIEHGDPNHDVYGLARVRLLATPRGDADARFELTYSHTQSQAPQVVGVTAPFRRRHDENGFYGVFRINVDALTATAHQPVGPHLAADMVMTAGDSDARRLAFPGLGQSHIRGRDWSAEATFNWSPDGPLHAVGGFSATHLALHQFINLSRLNGIGTFNDAQASAGIFGEASVTVFPGATLTAGLRYQQDRQKRSGALGTPLNKIPLDYDRTFHAWLPKVSLAYDISPAVRLGMFAERAYNPGGTTLRFDTGQPDNFGAEKLWDYEGFVRAKLGHGLSASGNLFYYDMRNAQRAKDINIIAPGGFGVGFADLFNVPRARSYGAEAELDWRPSTRLSGRFALGMLRTRIIRSAAGYAEFDGKEFARSPHLTAAAAVDWQANRRLRLSAQVRHHGRYFSDDSNDPLLRIAGSTIADARAAYELGRASLFVQVRNVFDKLALVDLGDPDFGEAEDPRRFMIGIETRF